MLKQSSNSTRTHRGDCNAFQNIAEYTARITDLKRNPQTLINDAKGEPIALLNHNRATVYIAPAETYERLMELAEDLELGQIIEKRKAEKGSAVEVDIDQL